MKGFSTPLVSVKWLSEHLEARNLIVLNATIPKVAGSEIHENSQIKGARFFDIKKCFSDINSELPNTFPSKSQFESEAQKLGVNRDSFLVIYDDHGIYSSPRAWWLFKALGHKNVAVLNGGLPAWKAENLPTEKRHLYDGAKGDFETRYQKNTIKNYVEVLSSLHDDSVTILDARSEDRFRGTVPEPREGLRSGHIPSSKNLPYTSLLDGYRMLPKQDLEVLFNSYQGKELIFSCGSGITACILALGAEYAGSKNLSVYDGSWTEWGSRHELPVEVD